MNQLAARPVPSRTAHVLAICTVVVALPLLTLGAEVTTKGVGMVDQAPLRTPWHLVTGWAENNGLGWVVEHSHRTFGWLIGAFALATFVAAWRLDGRRWLTVLSFAAGFAVLVQGALGIFRIHLNSLFGNSTALIHGAFAPIVLSLLITTAVSSSKNWTVGWLETSAARRLRIWCVTSLAAMFAQIVLGGFIRHKDQLLAGRLHLLMAFVVFSFVWVAIKYAREADYGSFKTLSRVLMALMTVQVMLGVEAFLAWLNRHHNPVAAASESIAVQLTRSAHYVVGAFLFATMAAMTAKAFFAPPARVEAAS
jgi:heme A synthase